jgi:Tol biopolymer transport system component
MLDLAVSVLGTGGLAAAARLRESKALPDAGVRFAAVLLLVVAPVCGQVASNGSTKKGPALLPKTSRVSVDPTGGQANHFSLDPTISTDGRFVAFRSAASNLVSIDANGEDDVFVYDRIGGLNALVSVSCTGEAANGGSFDAFISPDGRYVGFASDADNLVPSDLNGVTDVFVRDLARGTTTRVSVSKTGEEGDALSFHASISTHGRYVAFHSRATNMVLPDANGLTYDVYVHDRTTRTTTRLSVSSEGIQGNGNSLYPKISSDGRYVVFESVASNLVPGDTNGSPDIFVHDRKTATTTRVSVSASGAQGNSGSVLPSISADGRYVTFDSFARNLVPFDSNNRDDIFVHDRLHGATELVTLSSTNEQSNSGSLRSSISADGRYVVFESFASNLVPLDTNDTIDVFLRDRLLGTTRRVSVSSFAAEGDFDSGTPIISADGRFVAFVSAASNLVSDDTNSGNDVFLRGPLH